MKPAPLTRSRRCIICPASRRSFIADSPWCNGRLRWNAAPPAGWTKRFIGISANCCSTPPRAKACSVRLCPHARPSAPALDGPARGQRPAQRDEIPAQTSGRGTGAALADRRGIELQKQSHDSVLREKDRMRGAFEKSCFYLLDNPCRKKLVKHPREWPHLGAVVPGYPFLHPLGEDFWELFWKIYMEKREPMPS